MAPKMRWTRSKRLLEEYEDENHNAEREVQEISNDQNLIKRTEDLYGCIKAVVPHHEVFVRSKNKMETKCEITLENLREDVKITLWGDTAREFDLDAIYNLPPPVLAVFTSLRIALFQQQPTPSSTNHSCRIIDPDIGQREDYEEDNIFPATQVSLPSTEEPGTATPDRSLTKKKKIN
ncbi:uncharacterized protein LOC133717936 isoform X2 [Rosa rugosa]|uniref:uncharacterized protein LOC133717936 isoform X2 n=1 Tax=Rosa rugosa TaxID=74645 RepID=UPI002B40C162|nr:uncharacterized protein LOC133717936 isoform X2 [Rosa rugosa]